MAFSNNLMQSLIGIGKPKLASLLKVSSASLFLFLIYIQVPGGEIKEIFVAQFIQGFSICLLGIFINVFIMKKHFNEMKWQGDLFVNLVRFGSKIFSINLLNSLIEPLVKSILAIFFGPSTVAVYEIANRIVLGVRSIFLSIGNLMIASFAKTSAKDTTKLLDEFLNFSTIIIKGSILIFSFLFIFLPHLKMIFLSSKGSNGDLVLFSYLILILGISWLFNSISATSYFVLLATRSSKEIFLSEIVKIAIIFIIGLIAYYTSFYNMFFVGILISYFISSKYLFISGINRVSKSSYASIFQILNRIKTSLILLIFSVSWLIFFNILSENFYSTISFQELSPFIEYLGGPIILTILTIKYGGLKEVVKLMTKLTS
jgi:O-antigen/teichoic acid export membrane protein